MNQWEHEEAVKHPAPVSAVVVPAATPAPATFLPVGVPSGMTEVPASEHLEEATKEV